MPGYRRGMSERVVSQSTTIDAPPATVFAIVADPRQHPIVAEDGGRLVGYLQLTVIPGLAFRGTRRGLIESVRVASDRRGQGLGERFIRHAVDLCREQGCRLVQLTSTNDRLAAHRFYERLGFEATHTGFKLWLG